MMGRVPLIKAMLTLMPQSTYPRLQHVDNAAIKTAGRAAKQLKPVAKMSVFRRTPSRSVYKQIHSNVLVADKGFNSPKNVMYMNKKRAHSSLGG